MTIKVFVSGKSTVYVEGRSSALINTALAVAFDSNNNVLNAYEVGKSENYKDFLIILPTNVSYLLVCGNRYHLSCSDVIKQTFAYTREETDNIVSPIKEQLLIEDQAHHDLSSPIIGSNYVDSTQYIGRSITFGSFGSHSIFAIPANSKVTINIISGGSYGFVLADANDKVLEYCSNSVQSYTFKAQTEPTNLYVSSNKFSSGYYVSTVSVKNAVENLLERTNLAEEDIVNIKEQLVINHHNTYDIKNQYISQGDGYIDYCFIGKNISECFGSHSKHNVYKILAGHSLKITMLNGGAYQFALCDSDGYIIEYCANMSSQDSEYQFAVVNKDTWLYASEPKIKEVLVTEDLSEKVKDVVVRLEQEENVDINYWYKKNIWWCGTSIPAGSDATLGSEETVAGNYPTQVGLNLGCNKLWNKAVGGSMCRANVRTGDYNGANISNITSALSMTLAEVESFIANYDTLRRLSLNSSWPVSLSDGDKSRMRAGSFENRLMPFLTGAITQENPTGVFPDLFVIDHGHNDYKYKKSDGTSDIGLLPTVENIQSGELAEDTFMTANNYAQLSNFLGYTDGNELVQRIPSGYLSSFVASLNRNCFIGAVNFIMTVILARNPKARFVFISNYEYQEGYNAVYAPLIPAQEYLATDWAFPICKVYEYLAFSKKIIPKAKEYFETLFADIPVGNRPAAVTNCINNNKDCFLFQLYNPDNVHPHSDISGDANKVYAGVIAEFIKTCR